MRRRAAALLLSLLVAAPASAMTERDRALLDATRRNDVEDARRLIADGADSTPRMKAATAPSCWPAPRAGSRS